MASGIRAREGASRTALRLLVAATALLIAMVGLGLLLTGPLADTPLGRWDVALPRYFGGHRQGGDVSQSLLVTSLAATPVVVAATLALAVVLRWLLGRWREPVFLAITVVGEVGIFLVTAALVSRPRPEVMALDVAPPTSSYPSGHTAAATAFYGALAVLLSRASAGRRWGLTAVAVAALIAVGVGFSRVYRGLHHPSDVVAGWLLGGVWLAVVTVLVLHDGSARRGGGPTNRL